MRILYNKYVLPIPTFFLIGIPTSAFAFQQHDGAEGLVVHQIAHILFFSGIIIFYKHINRTKTNGVGWFEFNTSLLFFLVWNCLTFYGHWYQSLMEPEKFVSVDGTTVALIVDNIWDILFYISKFDHLILVPAFLYLSFALFKWRKPS